MPPPPPWVVKGATPSQRKDLTPEERIRGQEEERLLREGIREELKPKPTLEDKIANINERRYKYQGELETVRGKMKGKKITDLKTGEEIHQAPPESVLRVYQRKEARLLKLDNADKKLQIKLTGQQAGRVPGPTQYAEALGPPSPEGGALPDYAKIEVDEPDGTVIRDPQGNLYVVRNGRLIPKEG